MVGADALLPAEVICCTLEVFPNNLTTQLHTRAIVQQSLRIAHALNTIG